MSNRLLRSLDVLCLVGILLSVPRGTASQQLESLEIPPGATPAVLEEVERVSVFQELETHETIVPQVELRDVGVVHDAVGLVLPEAMLEPDGEAGPKPLHWKAGAVILNVGLDAELVEMQRRAAEVEPSPFAYVVVQHAFNPTVAEIEALAGWGFEELDYIPEDGFIVRVQTAYLDELANLPFVRAVAPLRPAWKIDPFLAETMRADPDALQRVTVHCFEPLSMAGDSPLVRVGDLPRYWGHLTPEQINVYLHHPLVKWIALNQPEEPALADSINVIAVDNIWAQGLDGTEVEVAIIDSGIENAHDHFDSVANIAYATDHVNGGAPEDCMGHGTHVAGIVTGQGTYNGQTFAGVAPDADLIIERVLGCNNDWHGGSYCPTFFDDVVSHGADIINCSWGHNTGGSYDSQASDTDDWARDHPGVVLVIANGNGILKSPGIAKNVIAVGATEDGTPGDDVYNGEPPDVSTAADVDLVSDLNNVVKPDDDRTKPDINAPGEWVTAPNLLSYTEPYTTWRGTSMATPHIAGVIALYKEAYGESVRSDLIKAALINTAVPLGTKSNQTSWRQGWGRVQPYDFIYRLIPTEAVDMSYSGSVSEGGSQYGEFTVPSGATQVRATMTYLDRAGSASANPARVNDVDMWLSSPSGAFFSISHENDTVDFVRVEDPEAGPWRIYIYGSDLPFGDSQEYAAVVSVLTDDPDIAVSVPSSVAVPQGSVFDLDISITASGWFAYGAYVKVETQHSSVSLASGSRSGWVAGDLLLETWQPSDVPDFVAASCGTFNNAIKVTVGGTNFSPITRYVDVTVAWCDGYEPDNTSGSANWIYDNSSQQHMIVPDSDVDWVKFSLSQESGVVLETSSNNFPGDTRMWLYDNSLSQVDYDDDGGPGCYSHIESTCEVDPLAAGTYYVKIDEYANNEEIWDYDLSLDVTPCGGGESHGVYLPVVLCSYDSSLLFFDDFSDASSGWATGETSNYKVGYQNGEYQLYRKTDGSVVSYVSVQCANCSVEVDARFEGSPSNAYGVVFAKSGSEYYAFLVWPDDATCDLVKWPEPILLDRSVCTLQQTSNRLRIEWDAPTIRTYVNGAQVQNISDSSYSGARGVGLMTYKQGDARYDNFAVYRLP